LPQSDECPLNTNSISIVVPANSWPPAPLRRELLREHKSLPRARDIRPVTVEVGDQPLHVVTPNRAGDTSVKAQRWWRKEGGMVGAEI
jgi:hypothetical protein